MALEGCTSHLIRKLICTNQLQLGWGPLVMTRRGLTSISGISKLREKSKELVGRPTHRARSKKIFYRMC
jgi:hypothetical protein